MAPKDGGISTNLLFRIAPELFRNDSEELRIAPETFCVAPEEFRVDPELFRNAPESSRIAPRSFRNAPEELRTAPQLFRGVPAGLRSGPQPVRTDGEDCGQPCLRASDPSTATKEPWSVSELSLSRLVPRGGGIKNPQFRKDWGQFYRFAETTDRSCFSKVAFGLPKWSLPPDVILRRLILSS